MSFPNWLELGTYMGEDPQLGQFWEDVASTHHFYIAELVSKGALSGSGLGLFPPEKRHKLHDLGSEAAGEHAFDEVHVETLVGALRTAFDKDASRWRLFFEVWDDCSIEQAIETVLAATV